MDGIDKYIAASAVTAVICISIFLTIIACIVGTCYRHASTLKKTINVLRVTNLSSIGQVKLLKQEVQHLRHQVEVMENEPLPQYPTQMNLPGDYEEIKPRTQVPPLSDRARSMMALGRPPVGYSMVEINSESASQCNDAVVVFDTEHEYHGESLV